MKKAGLLVKDESGDLIAVTLCNEKSRIKTLERGELWILDPATERVLPLYGGGARTTGAFVTRDQWFEITVSPPATTAPESTTAPPPPTTASTETRRREAGSDTATPARSDAAASREEAEGAGTDLPTGEAAQRTGLVLTHLAETIAQRRRTMPEGSYTTHLFTKGSGKIRKKTGEEAVELILAESPDELLSEAADLIYHLMVLLEAEQLSLGDVIDVLAERFS